MVRWEAFHLPVAAVAVFSLTRSSGFGGFFFAFSSFRGGSPSAGSGSFARFRAPAAGKFAEGGKKSLDKERGNLIKYETGEAGEFIRH